MPAASPPPEARGGFGISGAFAIVTPAVAVTAPAANATLYAGTPATISWSHNMPGVATALIELSRDGGASFEMLAAAAPNTGSFVWTATGPDSVAALVRVTMNGPPFASGASGAFAVVDAGPVGDRTDGRHDLVRGLGADHRLVEQPAHERARS